MIKFFRHIRRSLIQENKMGRYFKYAIGEIILVVLGILIALQINNWNSYKNDRAEEHKLLKFFKQDLQSDIADFDLNIDQTKTHLALQDSLLRGLEDIQNYTLNDFVRHTRIFGFRGDFRITSGTYTESTSSGKITLIQSDSIRKAIMGYYSYRKTGADWAADDIMNLEIMPDWYKHLAHTKEFAQFIGTPSKKRPNIDIVKLSKDNDFIAAITKKTILQNVQLRQWQFKQAKTEDLIKLIEDELNNRFNKQ